MKKNRFEKAFQNIFFAEMVEKTQEKQMGVLNDMSFDWY